MAGELNFKAVFDYGDAKKSVDELYDIFEKGSVKINEAFNMGRTVDANRKQLRDMISITRQTLKELEAVYKSTMDEIKQAGGLEYVSQKEREYVKDLGEGIKSTRELINGLQENLKEQNFDKNVFAGLTQGLQGLMGAYTAASGIMAQFGADEEDLVRIQTKLQASMSILMGIQQVYNTLQSTSAFRIQIVTKATELYAKAQAALAKSSTLAKLGIAGLAAGVAIAAIKIISSQNKIAKANKEAAEQYKAISEQASKSAASQITTFHKLQTQWQETNGNVDAQKRLVAENKDEWKKLGLEVNNINDYEKYAVEQAPAIIDAMTKKAQAAANLAVAEGLYAQAIQARMDSENGQKTKMNFFQGLFAGAAMGGGATGGPSPYGMNNYNAVKENFEQQNQQKYINKAEELEGKAKKLVEEANKLSEEASKILPGNGPGGSSGNLAEANARYAELVAKQQRDLQRQIVDLEFDTQQARINAMEEGAARTLAQIDLDYRKEKENINRWYDDLIDEKITRDRELWNADPKNKGKAFNYNRADYTHSPEEDALYGARMGEISALRTNARQQVFDNYLTFAQKFNKLSAGFSKNIKSLKDAGASIDAIGVASNKAKDSFVALARQWAESGWDDGLVDMSILLGDLEGQLEIFGDELPSEEVELLTQQIQALKEAMGVSTEEVESNETSWTQLHKVLSDTAELFDKIGSSIGGPFGEGIAIIGKFASSIGQIGAGIEALNKENVTAAESFSAGVSIVGAAVSIYSTVASKIREAKEHTDDLSVATAQYERVLMRIKESRVLDNFTNAFGANAIQSYITNVGIAKDAQDRMNAILSGFSSGGYTAKNNGNFAEVTMQHIFTDDLVSDMRNRFQQFMGSMNNIFSANLADFFDEGGNLLGEELQAWYETYGSGLSAENKVIVEDLLAEWERWEDAVKSATEYLGQLFNNIAGSLADKMIENFIATGSAIVDMTDYLDDFSRKLAKSIIQGQLMKQVFTETAQDEIGQLIAQGQIAEAVDYYNSLLGRANELAPAFGEWLKQIDIKDAVKSQTATIGGFQTMSQDVANELNGRFAALQIAGENILLESRGIHADTSLMAVSVEEMRNLSLISMGYLEGIEKNTRVLPEMSERMERIERYSKQMVS